MAQTNLTIRIDEDVKHDAETLFNELGMSLSGAINIFFRQAVRERSIPFAIKGRTAEEKYNEYFNAHNMMILNESVKQAERNEVITFTIDELKSMESGDIPERVKDFLNLHEGNTIDD